MDYILKNVIVDKLETYNGQRFRSGVTIKNDGQIDQQITALAAYTGFVQMGLDIKC